MLTEIIKPKESLSVVVPIRSESNYLAFSITRAKAEFTEKTDVLLRQNMVS